MNDSLAPNPPPRLRQRKRAYQCDCPTPTGIFCKVSRKRHLYLKSMAYNTLKNHCLTQVTLAPIWPYGEGVTCHLLARRRRDPPPVNGSSSCPRLGPRERLTREITTKCWTVMQGRMSFDEVILY